MKRHIFLCFFILFNLRVMAHPIEILTEQKFVEHEVFHFESENEVLRSCAILSLDELKEKDECQEFAPFLISAKDAYSKFQKALDSGTQLSQNDLTSFQEAIDHTGGLNEENLYSYQYIYMLMLVGAYEKQFATHKQ